MTVQFPRAHPALRAVALAALLALGACGSESPQSLMESGKAALAKSDPKTAAIQFKNALQKDPTAVEARILLGQALLDSGDPAGAVLELNKALDQKAPAERVVPALVRALLLSGEYKKIVNLYSDLVLTDKQAQGALKATVAAAWGALGDREKTEAAAAAALAAAPDLPAALILEARLLAGRQKYDEALARVDKVLSRSDREYEAWVLKGEILDVARKDRAGADAAFRKALAAQPAFLPAHNGIIGLAIRNRDFVAAKAQAAELKKLLPNHPISLFVDAQLAFLDRELTRSRDLTQQILKVAPNHAGVLLLAGSVEGQLGSLFAAETYFSKALQIDPELQVARRSLARVYVMQGQPDKALQTLKPILDRAAELGDADAFSLAAEAELRLNHSDRAEAWFRQAARVAPDDVRARTAVALTRLRRGEASQMFADLEQVAASSQEIIAEQAIFGARMKRHEFNEALRALDAMEKKQPGKAMTAELRGRVLLAQRNLPGARGAFEEALKRDAAYFGAVSNLAAMDVMEKKPADAEQRFRAALKADPRNYLASLALAELMSRADAPVDDIRKILQEAITAAPQQSAPRLSMISLLIKKRLFKDALVAAQETLAAMPGDLGVLDAVGRAQMEAGDVEQAVSTFRKLAGASANPASAYLRLGDVFRVSGKREQAEVALRKAIEIDPDFMPAHKALVDMLVASKRQGEVLKYVQQLQRDRPEKQVGYMLEATYHLRSKDTPNAVAAYRRGLAKTSHPDIARELYKLYLDSGQRAEADRFSVEWLKAHPDDGAMDFQVAVTMIADGQLEAAETRLARIVSRFPDNALAVNNLAWVLATRGRPGAVAMAQRAVDLAPGNTAVMDTMANALASEKQFDKALALQKEAIALAPRDASLRLSLARIALQAGDKDTARAELKSLQALGPKFARQEEVTRLSKQL